VDPSCPSAHRVLDIDEKNIRSDVGPKFPFFSGRAQKTCAHSSLVALSRNGQEELSPSPKALSLFPPLPGAAVPAEFRQKSAHREEPDHLRLLHQRRNYFIFRSSLFPFRHILSIAQEKNGSKSFILLFFLLPIFDILKRED